ncbi:hypothetical protein CDAR_209541 [Caerostris darwini]|uniref:Uncharacterized protein n=1 Tax=Caerostris darwini TaxID=1538125 RepID=A0AAV4WSJ7_9ARAC|nr:hypothetical protein CDAR_209541 [Caerostris darwini]
MGSKFVSQSIKKLKCSRTKVPKTCQVVELSSDVLPTVDIETKNIPFDDNIDSCVEVPRQIVLSQRAQRLKKTMIANSERKLQQRMKTDELVFRSLSTCIAAKRLGLQAKLAVPQPYPKNYLI